MNQVHKVKDEESKNAEANNQGKASSVVARPLENCQTNKGSVQTLTPIQTSENGTFTR